MDRQHACSAHSIRIPSRSSCAFRCYKPHIHICVHVEQKQWSYLKSLGANKYVGHIINGNKILIRGNHDNWTDEFYREAGFKYVSRYPIVWNDFYLLSHAPLQLSETTPYFNYYGHVHNDDKYVDTASSKCVCVERISYTPMLLKIK